MECGLRQAPLPSPEIAFADEQALAKKAFDDALGQLALVKFRLLDDQYLLDVVRMIQENAVLKGNRHANNVAVLARDAAQRAQGVLANGQRQAQDGQSAGAGRASSCVCGHWL